jgi:two-component sensor histidine kinase
LRLPVTLAYLKRLLDTILNFGVEDHHSPHLKRKIRTTNFLNLVVAASLLLGYTTFFFTGQSTGFTAITVFLGLSLVSVLLSWRRQTQLAFLLFTLNVNIAIFFINQFYPFGAGAFLYYFPLIVSVVLLNNPSFRDRYTIMHLGLCVVFFTANLLVDVPGIKSGQMSDESMNTTWHYNLVLSALITGLLCVQLSRIIARQNREIMAQNESLTRAQQAVSSTLREKEILLAELHHRVKNNLAIISGLLNLQGDATSNDEARQIISDSKNRILSMALVHRMLFENPSLKSIDIARYSRELIAELFNTYNLQKSVAVIEDYEDLVLPVSKSIPLGLILNEIVTNSIKYAFRGNKQKGEFRITIRKHKNNRVLLCVQDSGKGFPANYDFNAPSLSLGIFLIKTLAEQIDGSVSFSNSGGARIELDFLQH